MKRKKTTVLLTLFGATVFTFIGCSRGSSSDSDKITITFWTLNTRQNALEEIIPAFNEANPDIEVIGSYYSTDGIKDACKVAAQSGSLPSMWFNWGGSLGGYYAQNGFTYDLTDYAQAHGWNDRFNSGALSLCNLYDQLCGYPTAYNVLGMYYRKDIFARYNLEVPTTFEEFESVCETLKQNGITPVEAAGLYGWHVMRDLEQFIEYYAGAELHDRMNLFLESWDNDAVKQAFVKYKEFCDKEYFPRGFISQDPNDTLIALGSGTAAMDLQGQWYDGNIIQDGLDINNFGWFPFPNGTGRVSAFAEMAQFNKNLTAEELDACVKFLDYYYSDENVEKYEEYYSLPLPLAGAKAPVEQKNVDQIIEYSAEHGTFTITDQAFPTEVADVLFAAQDAVYNGTMDADTAAANIQAAIERYLAEN